MAKNQIHIRWLIFQFLCLNALTGIDAKTLLPVSGEDNYIPFSSLQGVFPRLRLNLNKITGVAVIALENEEIRTKTGSSFYTYGLKIEKISNPVYYKKRELWLPPDIIEAVFLNLVKEEISYQYHNQYLEIEKGEKKTASIHLKNIIIDPGHGGKDPGTSDSNGYFEKDIVLQLGKLLEQMIRKKFPGVNVVMTRKGDTFVSLEKRAAIANHNLKKNQDSVYISLHCNSTLNPEPGGYEIYFFSQTASTESARELSIIENRILESNYSDPVQKIQADMLSSLIQRQSRTLSDSIDGSMENKVSKYISRRGVKKADFAVLRGSLMPAVLIEIGYLSNKKDSLYLKNERVQKIIANSIMEGIKGYAEKTKF